MGLSVFRVRDFRNCRDKRSDLADDSLAEQGRIKSGDESFRFVRDVCQSGLEDLHRLAAIEREREREQFKQFCKEYGVPLKFA